MKTQKLKKKSVGLNKNIFFRADLSIEGLNKMYELANIVFNYLT